MAIVEFARVRERLDRRAYSWRMWGVAPHAHSSAIGDDFLLDNSDLSGPPHRLERPSTSRGRC